MNGILTFGERVRELRKKKRISQNALAKLAGVSPRTIFGYEAGTTYPRTEALLHRLAEALDVTGEELAAGAFPGETMPSFLAGRSPEAQAGILARQIVSLLQGDSLSDGEKDAVAQAIMDAYWESRTKSREKNDAFKE